MSRINSLSEFKQRFRTIIEFPVAWGEQDAFQHINNIYYFRYFESVRMHYLGLIGGLDYLKQHNVGPILASTDCKFVFPITYPDTIFVGAKTELTTLSDDRFEMSYGIWSPKLDRLCALSSSSIVYYDYDKLSKTPVPKILHDKIIQLES